MNKFEQEYSLCNALYRLAGTNAFSISTVAQEIRITTTPMSRKVRFRSY